MIRCLPFRSPLLYYMYIYIYVIDDNNNNNNDSNNNKNIIRKGEREGRRKRKGKEKMRAKFMTSVANRAWTARPVNSKQSVSYIEKKKLLQLLLLLPILPSYFSLYCMYIYIYALLYLLVCYRDHNVIVIRWKIFLCYVRTAFPNFLRYDEKRATNEQSKKKTLYRLFFFFFFVALYFSQLRNLRQLFKIIEIEIIEKVFIVSFLFPTATRKKEK